MKNIIALFSNFHFFETKHYILFFLLFIFINNVIKVGKKRMYQLGLMLRDRYNSFLGNMYYQPHIYARSTMFARTKMSLQLVFAALYPPTDMQKWNPQLLWQPMDFTYFNITHDKLLFPIQCPE